LAPVNESEEPTVINLMDALKKSLGSRRVAGPTPNGKPGRRKKGGRRKAA